MGGADPRVVPRRADGVGAGRAAGVLVARTSRREPADRGVNLGVGACAAARAET